MESTLYLSTQSGSTALSNTNIEVANGPTAYLLKQLSMGLIEAQNMMPAQEGIAFLQKHMSSDWIFTNEEGRECALPAVVSRKHQMDNLLALKQSWPEWRLEIFQIAACVDADPNFGISHYSGRSNGRGPEDFNSNRELVGILYWRRKDNGIWECYRNEGLRGPADFSRNMAGLL